MGIKHRAVHNDPINNLQGIPVIMCCLEKIPPVPTHAA